MMARPTAEISRLGSRSLVFGGVGLAAARRRLLRRSRVDFWESYLIGYIFWIGSRSARSACVMVQHLTGGAWTMASRRLLEAATRNLPLMALLFLPIWFNLEHLYPWVNPDPNDEAMQHVLHLKGAYLNKSFFGIRAAAVLRHLGRSRLLPEQVVAPAGRDARAAARSARSPVAHAVGPGPRALRRHRHVHERRLGHVARSRTGSRRSSAC